MVRHDYKISEIVALSCKMPQGIDDDSCDTFLRKLTSTMTQIEQAMEFPRPYFMILSLHFDRQLADERVPVIMSGVDATRQQPRMALPAKLLAYLHWQ